MAVRAISDVADPHTASAFRRRAPNARSWTGIHHLGPCCIHRADFCGYSQINAKHELVPRRDQENLECLRARLSMKANRLAIGNYDKEVVLDRLGCYGSLGQQAQSPEANPYSMQDEDMPTT